MINSSLSLFAIHHFYAPYVARRFPYVVVLAGVVAGVAAAGAVGAMVLCAMVMGCG